MSADGPETTIDIDAPVVPRMKVGRWVGIIALIFSALFILVLLKDAQIQWSTIPGFFTSQIILDGLRGTIVLTVSTMLLAFLLGIILAIMRMSSNQVMRILSAGYVWLFRAVPQILQLILWFNIGLVVRTIDIPFVYSGPTSDLVTPFVAALLGLGLAEAAYMAEIIRGGMLAIDKGQSEAALSLGMSPLQAVRRIVLPQALKIIIPPTGNEVIGMMKFTSLAFAVAYSEILSQAARIYSTNFLVIEVLMAAAVWYMILTAILSVGQRWLERSLDVNSRQRRAATAGGAPNGSQT